MHPLIVELVERYGVSDDLAAQLDALVRSDGATVAGRYVDLGVIARGGMGEVRRVRDLELNRVLAMKTIHGSLMVRHQSLARFLEEAQATAQLQHPSIVPVHDLEATQDGRPAYAMKLIEGTTFFGGVGYIVPGKLESNRSLLITAYDATFADPREVVVFRYPGDMDADFSDIAIGMDSTNGLHAFGCTEDGGLCSLRLGAE